MNQRRRKPASQLCCDGNLCRRWPGGCRAVHELLAPRDARSGVADRLKDTRVKPESFCVWLAKTSVIQFRCGHTLVIRLNRVQLGISPELG